MITRIESAKNPTFKLLKKLQERKHFRIKENLFVIEGERELKRAQMAKIAIDFYVFAEESFKSAAKGLNVTSSQVVYLLPQPLFEDISLRESPDGMLGIAKPWTMGLDQLRIPENGALFLVAEGIEKPGNLGGLIRSAEAAGVDGLLLADAKVDIFNPSVIRNSQGAVFGLSIAWDTKENVFSFLQANKIKMFATTPQGKKTYWEVEMSGATAICMGAEDEGLTSFWLDRVEPVRIPMCGYSADSLNVQVAATLCLYEALRQRNEKKTWQNF